jgi:Protein of unknown function (DUF1616)
MQFKSITVIIVLLLLVASLSIAGCTSSTTNQTSSASPSAQASPTPIPTNLPTNELFTSLALLSYPTGYQDLIVNQTNSVKVRVVNHENASADYRLVVTLTNKTIYSTSFGLSNNPGWERSIAFTPTQLGMGQKLNFNLYKGGNSSVYRNVYLYVNVISLI